MKSLANLHHHMLSDLGAICSVDTTRDAEYFLRRVEEEGDGFLTITLPTFAKALERGLAEGQWFVAGASSFRLSGRLPAFLRGFTTKIFQKDGMLLEDPDATAIWAVRQFCYLTQKIGRECAPERVAAAFDQYVSTDRELVGLPGRIDPGLVSAFKRTSISMFGDLMDECEKLIASFSLLPKHGPGSVAESLSPREKWDFAYWTQRLEDVFPFWRYTQNVPVAYSHTDPVPIGAERPVKVITVPKTQSTPRIIAIEPSSMQYAQQALKNAIYRIVERGPLNGILGFTDQTRNQLMAQKASETGEFATLDLSEASDRVHWWLVGQMFHAHPHLRDYVLATRSLTADVPGYGVIPLTKYASMGSALTFPLEAMVFTIIAAMGVQAAVGIQPRPRKLAGVVSVYGDDIIIPVDATVAVVDLLEHFGARVNRHKSFWSGKFRESCGGEFFNGQDVTVTRLRQDIPRSRRDATELASFVQFRNQLFEAGLWGVVRELDPLIESLIRFAPAQDTSSALTSRTFLPVEEFDRWSDTLHRWERKLPYLHGTTNTWSLDGHVGLWKWFVEAESSPVSADKYASQERPTAFSIYSRWTPAR